MYEIDTGASQYISENIKLFNKDQNNDLDQYITISNGEVYI